MGDDDDGLKPTPEEAAKLAELHRQRGAKMDEIVALLAWRLGYGDPATLSADQRDAIETEAEQVVDRWMEDAEMADPPSEPTTPLQRLLREHHDLGEMILDIQDGMADRDEGAG